MTTCETVKVYISCHHPDPANELAGAITAAGHEVVSTWHTESGPRPAAEDAEAWAAKADANLKLIGQADVLCLIAGPDRYPGGKFVEAGYALGQFRPVYVVGRVENGMLHAAGKSVADAAELLAAFSADFGDE